MGGANAGGLLLVGLLVAAFGVANVLRPSLFTGPAAPEGELAGENGLASDGGESDSNGGLLLKQRVLGACCVVFGAIVASVAVLA